MADSGDWILKEFVWEGPQQMSENGLELHAVVAEDTAGCFHAGTRYGPRGGAMPELGAEEFFCVETYKNKTDAILAAKSDAARTLADCNGHARTEGLLQRATTSKSAAKPPHTPTRQRSIDR